MSQPIALLDSPDRFDDEIPASRLLRERDQARTEAAQRHERELRLVADLERMRIARDRETDKLNAALAELGRAKASQTAMIYEVEMARRAHRAATPAELVELASLRGQLEVSERTRVNAEAETNRLRSLLAELLEGDAGEDCPECCGTGEMVDEIDDEFGVQVQRGECVECFNGRVVREVAR